MSNIGTLNEKSIHAALKKYFCEDESKHEVRVNNYIADILNNGVITEIQSKDFSKLKDKLDEYTPNYKVKIVYPVSTVKYINWVDPITRDVLERRKSPSRGSIYDIFKELYKIREYLTNQNISFAVITLETEEYKYLDGYGPNNKNRATKIDKIPTKVLREINFGINGGYEQFIPDTLKNNFTSNDLKKEVKADIKSIRLALLLLNELGIVKRTGKTGNSYTYQVIQSK